MEKKLMELNAFIWKTYQEYAVEPSLELKIRLYSYLEILALIKETSFEYELEQLNISIAYSV